MTPEERRLYHREYYHKNKRKSLLSSQQDSSGRFVKQIDLTSEIDKIINLYTIDNLSTYKISQIYDVDKTTINRLLRDNNIVIRGNNVAHLLSSGKRNPRWTGYEEISGAYWSTVYYGATKARELSFDLNIKDCWELFLKQNRKCALSGIDIAFATLNKDFLAGRQTASLDRINSNIGYRIDNVWWVHKKINIIKRDLQVDDFIELCKLVANYNRSN